MDHTKPVLRTRSAGPAQRALLVLLATVSLLAADQAMARRRNSGLPPGIQLKPVAQLGAQPDAVPPPVIKPILHPGRHGAKPRGSSR